MDHKMYESEWWQLLHKSVKTTLLLLRILIPISIIVKILELAGVITWLGVALSGVMGIVGLPGEFGLVWATAMMTNIYGGMVVFFNLSQGNVFSVGEVTVLASMILVAHSLPIEIGITKRAGVKVWYMLLLRVMGAFVLGWLLSNIYHLLGVYTNPANLIWEPSTGDGSISSWIVAQLQSYLLIFAIITALLVLMKILEELKMLEWLNHRLEPCLEWLGMTHEAAPLAMIGVTLGLSYGGGLMIGETRSGRLSIRDIVLSMSMMGLCHSLIEDSLLMLSIGAALSGVFLARFVFMIIVTMILARLFSLMPDDVFSRWFISRS